MLEWRVQIDNNKKHNENNAREPSVIEMRLKEKHKRKV